MKFWPVTCYHKQAIFVLKQMFLLKQLYEIGPRSGPDSIEHVVQTAQWFTLIVYHLL